VSVNLYYGNTKFVLEQGYYILYLIPVSDIYIIFPILYNVYNAPINVNPQRGGGGGGGGGGHMWGI
jgi:hypothetical protein